MNNKYTKRARNNMRTSKKKSEKTNEELRINKNE